MANKILFPSLRQALLPKTTTHNHENSPAYELSPKQALAQYAATGCFGRTFYATAEEQLSRVLVLCEKVEPTFVARLAIYSRKQARLKDMPALLCAWLSTKDGALHEAVFAEVIDNARLLRNYVQILRSGVVGRKSLGTAPKRLVCQWLAAREPEAIFRASVGQSPSLADIVKMVHPKPDSSRRAAFYGYLLNQRYDAGHLPGLVTQFEQFKAGESLEVPNLPFMMLSALPLSQEDWMKIAQNASRQTTRMNLNTFARHGLFSRKTMVYQIASRLKDEAEVARAGVLPYQLLTAFQNCDGAVPREVKDALQDAMEFAIQNVPVAEGQVVICPDVSGSMKSAVTGFRKGSASATRCIDVAALMAAAIVRKNPTAVVLPFERVVVPISLNPRDSGMTNATRLASLGGGGTNCSAQLAALNRRKAKADLVLFVSDNQSWADGQVNGATALMAEWATFRERNPQARLVCLDIQPYETTPAVERADILNIGGLSDRVFEVIAAFAAGELEPDHWVGRIEATAA